MCETDSVTQIVVTQVCDDLGAHKVELEITDERGKTKLRYLGLGEQVTIKGRVDG